MRPFKFVLGIILLSMLIWNLLPEDLLNAKGSGTTQFSSDNFREPIFDATLQILVYPKEGDQRERGIGTLISFSGEELIVTHNHWEFLNDLRKVEIWDARDNFLIEVTAKEFRDLVRYSDRGNLIFTAPEGLRVPAASLGKLDDLRAGDKLSVVHQASDSEAPLELLEAEVREIADYNGLPVVRFVSVGGKEIRPGDSGGGVWFEGQLIGNTWGMYFEEGQWFLPGSQEVQISNVAQLPVYFLELMEDSQGPRNYKQGDVDLRELKVNIP